MSDNPFTKKAEKAKEADQSRGKPGRKPMTPNFDQVLAAVERGEYDEDLHELTEAIKGRNKHRQEHVLRLVSEVFGDDAVIEFTSSGTTGDLSDGFTRSRMGLQGEDSVLHNAIEAKSVAEEWVEVAQAAVESTVDVEEPPAGSEADGFDAELDQVEARMAQEAAQEDLSQSLPPGQASPPVQYIPPEQRGATISGLHSSQMGD